MLAPLSAWIALRGELVLSSPSDLWPPLVLGAAVLMWVAGFDIIYACQDVEFDQHAKLHSVPAAVGVAGALRVAAACHGVMIAALAALPFVDRFGGPVMPLGPIYGGGVAAVAALLLYEHWLVRPDDLRRVNVAFFHVNSVVSIGLFVITSIDLLIDTIRQ